LDCGCGNTASCVCTASIMKEALFVELLVDGIQTENVPIISFLNQILNMTIESVHDVRIASLQAITLETLSMVTPAGRGYRRNDSFDCFQLSHYIFVS
jgi:hypothetical protein